MWKSVMDQRQFSPCKEAACNNSKEEFRALQCPRRIRTPYHYGACVVLPVLENILCTLTTWLVLSVDLTNNFTDWMKFGHVVISKTTNPAKMAAVRSGLNQKNVKETLSFLGPCSCYRRKNFADIAQPLHHQTEKDSICVDRSRGMARRHDFETRKRIFNQFTHLRIPHRTRHFRCRHQRQQLRNGPGHISDAFVQKQ